MQSHPSNSGGQGEEFQGCATLQMGAKERGGETSSDTVALMLPCWFMLSAALMPHEKSWSLGESGVCAHALDIRPYIVSMWEMPTKRGSGLPKLSDQETAKAAEFEEESGGHQPSSPLSQS